MEGNRYVRPDLAATRDGVPDPAIEVEGWLDRLDELLAQPAGEPDALACYDLLALWAKLRRVRPELVADLGGESETAGATRLVRERGAALVRAALTIPNPAAWLEDALALEAAYEIAGDPVERSTLAERLLADLDEAELVAYAARHCGTPDPALEGELDRCRAWVAAHADLFLAACVHVQAVGMALRPDLAEEDYDLALTALKYEQVLDAAEAAEEALALRRLSPLPLRTVAEAARRFRQEQGRRQAAAPTQPTLVFILLDYRRALRRHGAFRGSSEEPPGETVVKWVSPGRDLVAYLPIPGEGEEAWTVAFYSASGEPAVQLAGEPAFLDGVAARVTPGASATFARQDLAAAPELELRLEVGAGRSLWDLQER